MRGLVLVSVGENGTDLGSLTLDGPRMYGPAKTEDCEVGTFDDVWVNVTRSSGVS